MILLSLRILWSVLWDVEWSLLAKNRFFEKLYKFEGSGATDDAFRRGSNFSIFGVQNSDRCFQCGFFYHTILVYDTTITCNALGRSLWCRTFTGCEKSIFGDFIRI